MTASPANNPSPSTAGPPPAVVGVPGVWDREQVVPLLVGLFVAITLHLLALVAFMGPSLPSWIWYPLTPAAQPAAANPPAPPPAAPPPRETPPPNPSRRTPPPAAATAIPRPNITPANPRPAHPVQKIVAPKNDIRFGRDHGDPTSIAWIGYDDFQKLIAHKGVTEQPALQKDVEPFPGAPIRPDPTPPHPTIVTKAGPPGTPGHPGTPGTPGTPGAGALAMSPPTPAVIEPEPVKPVLPMPNQSASTSPPSPPSPVVKSMPPVQPPGPQPPQPDRQALADAGKKLPIIDAPTRTTDGLVLGEPVKPVAVATPVVKPVEEVKPSSASGEPVAAKPSTPTPQPSSASTAKPVPPGANGSNGSPGSPGPAVVIPAQAARPTGAPKSDSESAPVSLTGSQKVSIRPGRVLAGEGIEIRTAVPRFSIASRFSSPRNPVVRVVFSKAGDVIDAEIITSSQYPNVDGPILASLYKWKASGKKLVELNRSFEVTISIILIDE